jgi:hypothetical protein
MGVNVEVPVTKAERLYLIAKKSLNRHRDSSRQSVPGKAIFSNTFIAALRIAAKQVCGQDYSEEVVRRQQSGNRFLLS